MQDYTKTRQQIPCLNDVSWPRIGFIDFGCGIEIREWIEDFFSLSLKWLFVKRKKKNTVLITFLLTLCGWIVFFLISVRLSALLIETLANIILRNGSARSITQRFHRLFLTLRYGCYILK